MAGRVKGRERRSMPRQGRRCRECRAIERTGETCVFAISARLGSARPLRKTAAIQSPIAASSGPGQWPRGTKVVSFVHRQSSLQKRGGKRGKKYEDEGAEGGVRSAHASRYAQETTRGEATVNLEAAPAINREGRCACVRACLFACCARVLPSVHAHVFVNASVEEGCCRDAENIEARRLCP